MKTTGNKQDTPCKRWRRFNAWQMLQFAKAKSMRYRQVSWLSLSCSPSHPCSAGTMAWVNKTYPILLW